MPIDVQAIAGTPVDISLERYATAGYAWEIQEKPQGIEITETSAPPAPTAAPGSPARQIFHITASKAGTYTIVLANKRRWESTPQRIETVTVTAK